MVSTLYDSIQHPRSEAPAPNAEAKETVLSPIVPEEEQGQEPPGKAEVERTISNIQSNQADAEIQAERDGRSLKTELAVLDQEPEHIAASPKAKGDLEHLDREVNDLAAKNTHQALTGAAMGLAGVEMLRQMLPGFPEAALSQVAGIAGKARDMGVGDMQNATGDDYFVTVNHGIGARGQQQETGQGMGMPT